MQHNIFVAKDLNKIKLTAPELIELIQHLKPDAVILPKNILKDCPQIWDNWLDSIVPFFFADDLQNLDIYFARAQFEVFGAQL